MAGAAATPTAPPCSYPAPPPTQGAPDPYVGSVWAIGDAPYCRIDRSRLPADYLDYVGISPNASGDGYWLATAGGRVVPAGNARNFGSMGGGGLNAPVVGVAATPSGGGYWLVASDGGVFTFGDARFTGAVPTFEQGDDIVGVAARGTTTGLWLMLNPQPPGGCQHICT